MVQAPFFLVKSARNPPWTLHFTLRPHALISIGTTRVTSSCHLAADHPKMDDLQWKILLKFIICNGLVEGKILQDSPILNCKTYGFRLRFSLRPIHWDMWFFAYIPIMDTSDNTNNPNHDSFCLYWKLPSTMIIIIYIDDHSLYWW